MVQRLLFSRRSLRKSPFSISFCHFCFFFYDYFQANIPIFFLPVLLCFFHLLDDLCLRTVRGLVGPFGYLFLFILATEFLLLLFVCLFVVVVVCLFLLLLFVVVFSVNISMSFPQLFDFIPSYHAIL